MRKSNLLLLILSLLVFEKIYSQNFTIIDSVTRKPIPFVAVLLKQEGKILYGNYCNQNGEAFIKEDEVFDTVEFSCIGYKSKSIDKFNLKKEMVVTLAEEVYKLDEVIISSKLFDSYKIIGYLNENKTSYEWKGNGETTLFIENESKDVTQIISILFKIRKVKSRSAYRVHFYKKMESHFHPGERLINEDIIGFIEPDTKGIIELDISQYALQFPIEGMFLSIEPLGFTNEKEITKQRDNGLFFEFHQTKKNIYFHRISFSPENWDNVNERLVKDYIYLGKEKVPSKNLIAPSFGIKIIR